MENSRDTTVAPSTDPEAGRRCRWPLGWSGNLAVMCGLPAGHDGSHRSSFELLTQEVGWCLEPIGALPVRAGERRI